MDSLQAVLAIIGGLVALLMIGAATWAVFRSSSQDARIKRLQDERDDYLHRLNFIEPKVEALTKQNELLMAMHNPADQISKLSVQEQANHEQTVTFLTQQNELLTAIHKDLSGRNGE